MVEFLTPQLFDNLIIGGLTTVTGLVAYFAKQVINGQQDLKRSQELIKQNLAKAEVKFNFLTEELLKESEEIINTKKDLSDMRAKITKEITRLSTITDMYVRERDSRDKSGQG